MLPLRVDVTSCLYFAFFWKPPFVLANKLGFNEKVFADFRNWRAVGAPPLLVVENETLDFSTLVAGAASGLRSSQVVFRGLGADADFLVFFLSRSYTSVARRDVAVLRR